MNMYVKAWVAVGFAAATLVSVAVSAQEDPGHPRVNEVGNRVGEQQSRTNAGVASGQITPAQAGRDEARDARVQRQAARDEANHNGHLTKHEQKKLNKELNKNSARIHHQRKAPAATPAQ